MSDTKFRRVLAMKMVLNFSEGILMAALSLISPESFVPVLAALSALYFANGINTGRFYKRQKASGFVEKGGIDNRRAPHDPNEKDQMGLKYEDTGQIYMYVVKAGRNVAECFSDIKYTNPDDITRIIQILEDDGKISIEDNSEVAVEVRCRKDYS